MGGYTCVACGREKKTRNDRHPRCRLCAAINRGPGRCGWCREYGHDVRICPVRIGHVEFKRRNRLDRAEKTRMRDARLRSEAAAKKGDLPR